VFRPSIQLRQTLSRLSLPVLLAGACGMLLLGGANAQLAERARILVADALTPVHAALAQPVRAVRTGLESLGELPVLRQENARLREENERLRRWQQAALALEAENALLRGQLAFVPEEAPAFHTVRVVADGGGIYARAVLVARPPEVPIRRGQVAIEERGFVGRVTEAGERSARILLATDINSRIPVTLEGSRARAIMAGTNGARPRLLHFGDARPAEGERVVTSAEGVAFPAGLPVGLVRWGARGVPEVELFARLDRLDVVRLFDFGLGGILPPEAVARPEPRPRR
jgi:rod shape-determining protein MreC